jgi:hypothetical protein
MVKTAKVGVILSMADFGTRPVRLGTTEVRVGMAAGRLGTAEGALSMTEVGLGMNATAVAISAVGAAVGIGRADWAEALLKAEQVGKQMGLGRAESNKPFKPACSAPKPPRIPLVAPEEENEKIRTRAY